MPVVGKSPEEAADHFGFLGYFLGLDIPASSAQTQERLAHHSLAALTLPPSVSYQNIELRRCGVAVGEVGAMNQVRT